MRGWKGSEEREGREEGKIGREEEVFEFSLGSSYLETRFSL